MACAQGASALGGEWYNINMYYVYIIKSEKNGKKYVGMTGDLKRRIKEHNNGSSDFTKDNGGPWKLVYYEALIDKQKAQIEEKFLKSGKVRERIKYLLD